jgi:hypothetical protein
MSLAKLLPRGATLKDLAVRSKKLLAGGAVCAALAIGALFPSSAQAYWGPGWGWHAGLAWRPGFAVGVAPVVVGAPVYAAPAYRWVPAHYTWRGFYVPGHWAY